jgi:hypothetical protein
MEGAVATREQWARIVVMRGDAARRLSFEAAQPARVIIGSASNAEFCLPQAEVAPRQLDVVWDGANLWLEDALRLGRTFVNGRRLNEWVAVLGQVVVSFGPIRLWMAAQGSTPKTAVPDFAALDRARLTEAHRNPDLRRSNTGRITLPPELRGGDGPVRAGRNRTGSRG